MRAKSDFVTNKPVSSFSVHNFGCGGGEGQGFCGVSNEEKGEFINNNCAPNERNLNTDRWVKC